MSNQPLSGYIASGMNFANGAPDYSTLQRQVQQQGVWSPMPRSWPRMLNSLEAAALLSHFLGTGKSSADNEGWVRADNHYLWNGLRLNTAAAGRGLAALRALDLIEVRGSGPTLQVRVFTGRVLSLGLGELGQITTLPDGATVKKSKFHFTVSGG